MAHPTRRALLTAAAATIAVLSFDEWLWGELKKAQAQTRPRRAEAGSPEGKRLIALYARGVDRMRGRPAHDPTSWLFQANIHDYPEAASGPDAVDTIFAEAQGRTPEERAAIRRNRELALGGNGRRPTWRTCSHFHGDESMQFLPWHRMELYFFERIVAAAIGGTEPFVLPYWDYRPNGANGRRLLPAEFIQRTVNGRPNPLYLDARNPEFKPGGQGLDVGDIALDQLVNQQFLMPYGRQPGFSPAIEGLPHGAVHGAVGTGLGMGSVAMAARDPIFWLHHANIDRLWESWRFANPTTGQSTRDPVSNATWMQANGAEKKFAFATEKGQYVEMTVTESLEAMAKLKIEYDVLQRDTFAPPAMSVAESSPPAASTAAPTTVSKSEQTAAPAQITTKNTPVRVKVAPAVSEPVSMGLAGASGTRWEMVVEIETAQAGPGVYDVVLQVAAAPGSDKVTDRVVGRFNLFGAGHGGSGSQGGHAGHTGPVTATWRANVTELVRQKLLDPRNPGEIVMRARYSAPARPIIIKSVRIDAR